MKILRLWEHYLPRFLHGTLITLELTAAALALAVALGFLTALARMSRQGLLRGVASTYIEIIRATPVLVLIILAYYGLPQAGIVLPGFVAASGVLGIFYATIYGEIFRGGIEGVGRGQTEAAQALGLTPSTTMRRVILPQTVTTILPPATNAAADLVKDTSLVVTIAVADLMYHAYGAASTTFLPMDMFALAGILYFLICYLLSHVLRRWEFAYAQRH